MLWDPYKSVLRLGPSPRAQVRRVIRGCVDRDCAVACGDSRTPFGLRDLPAFGGFSDDAVEANPDNPDNPDEYSCPNDRASCGLAAGCTLDGGPGSDDDGGVQLVGGGHPRDQPIAGESFDELRRLALARLDQQIAARCHP